VESGDVERLRFAIRDHHLEGFPEYEAELGKRRADALSLMARHERQLALVRPQPVVLG
jgi:hypothetical protein